MLIKLNKYLLILFMIYNFWYRYAFSYNQVIMYVGVFITSVISLLIVLLNRANRKSFPKGLWMWVALGVYALIFGVLVATDTGSLLSSLLKYFASLAICFSVCIVSDNEDSLDWLLNTILVIAFLISYTTIFAGYGTRRISMGENHNTNYLGIFLVYGIFCLVYRYHNKNKNLLRVLVKIVVAMIFLFVIVLSGSRKALIAAAILFIIWSIAVLRDFRNENRFLQFFGMLLLLFVTSYIGYRYFLPFYMGSYSYERMMGLLTDTSGNVRWTLMKEAKGIFFNHPLVGVGFNQFHYYSIYDTYSHSTYFEILACCGIFGAAILFAPFISAGITVIKRLRYGNYQDIMMFALFCVLMFLAIGVILFYDAYHLIFVTCVIFYLNDSQKITKQIGNTKSS